MKRTCLEKRSMDARHRLLAKNEYSPENRYSAKNKNALATGDKKGKGTDSIGYMYVRSNKYGFQDIFNFENFDTHSKAGNGTEDILVVDTDRAARARSLMYNKYDEVYQYNVLEDVLPGQYSTNMTTIKGIDTTNLFAYVVDKELPSMDIEKAKLEFKKF